MKIILSSLIVGILFTSRINSQSIFCDNCKDNWSTLFCMAWHRKTNCNNFMIKLFYCPLTCKMCELCSRTSSLLTSVDNLKISLATSRCEMDTCVDEMSKEQCSVILNLIENGCNDYGSSCRNTCGFCAACEEPPPPCLTNCKDKHRFCDGWKENGYCIKSSQHQPFMKESCPLSCGFCKLCSTEAPTNTALPPAPPTEPECSSSGCKDTNQSCEYWADNGFCHEYKGYPYTKITCPKSCGLCIQCSTTSPPIKIVKPVCSEDCRENNSQCGYWKYQGYCKETSEFYSFMERNCPVTCEICNPCSL